MKIAYACGRIRWDKFPIIEHLVMERNIFSFLYESLTQLVVTFHRCTLLYTVLALFCIWRGRVGHRGGGATFKLLIPLLWKETGVFGFTLCIFQPIVTPEVGLHSCACVHQ